MLLERGRSQVPGGEGSSRCGWKRKEGLPHARGSVAGLQCFSDGRGPVPEGNGRWQVGERGDPQEAAAIVQGELMPGEADRFQVGANCWHLDTGGWVWPREKEQSRKSLDLRPERPFWS